MFALTATIRNQTRLPKLAFSAASVLFTAHAIRGSSVLFDSGNPGFGDAFVSDPQFPIQYGNDFAFSTAAELTSLSWYGAYKPPGNIGPDDFSIRIFALTAGVPNTTPLASFSGMSITRNDTGTALPFPGEEIFDYEAAVPATYLGPGTYLLSIINNTAPGDALWLWAWSDESFQAGKALYSRAQDGDAWGGPFTTQVSFQLLGDPVIPEPSSSALVASGFLALVLAVRLFSRGTPDS